MTLSMPVQTSDFSAIANRYDASREIPVALLQACYQRLIELGLLPRHGTILDAGCGTGQISLPLAEMGFGVRGFDVSLQMAAIAQAKCRPEWDARYATADVCALPAPDEAFDAVVFSKLLQHVRDWKGACAEFLRVLRAGGCIVEVRDRGLFGNAVRRHFAARADALGHVTRYVGLDPRDRLPLGDFLLGRGCERIAVDVTDLRWTRPVRFGEALDQLRDRVFAEFWYLPDDVHHRLLAATADWIERQPEGRATVEVMTPHLSLEVFRKVVTRT